MEHKLITEERTVRESALVAYAYEPDDSVDETFNDTPYQAVKLSCTCGKFNGWAAIGEDVTERFERHVKLAGMKL